VESSPGKGSTFHLYFPVCKDIPEQKQTTPLPIATHVGTGTILLVEDEQFVRDMLVRLLDKMGYAVIAVEEPGRAVDLFSKEKDSIDLLISDVVMPGISGPEMYSRMCEIKPDLPVLFVTGYDANHKISDMKANPTGAYCGLLQKPFRRAELSAKLNEVFGARE
jgi:CheY-like chemotaxis protein